MFASISSRINTNSRTDWHQTNNRQFKWPQSSVPRRNLGYPSPPGTGTHHGCFGQFEHRPGQLFFVEVSEGFSQEAHVIIEKPWSLKLSFKVLLMQNNPAKPVDMVVYPIIYKVLCIPGGCLGVLPSTV